MEKIKIVKPKIIRTKKYKTIDIVLVYPIMFQQNHFFDLKILRNILSSTSLEYPLEKDFKNAMLKNLIINYSSTITRVNKNIFFKVYLTIPNPKDIEDFNIKSAFQFFFNSLYKPNIVDNKFKEEDFEREKNFIISRCKNNHKDIYGYSYDKFMKYLEESHYNSFSEYKNLNSLEKLTASSLYNYYQENIYQNIPLVFVYGNILKKEIDNLFKDYFLYVNENNYQKNFSNYKETRNKPLITIENKKEFQDSVLNIAYSISNMQEKDEIYLRTLNNVILRSLGVSLFFKKLRLDNNLVYSVYNSVVLNRGLLIIETYINKDNYEKVLSLIEEVLEELKRKENLQLYREKCLINLKYSMIRKKDDKYDKLDEVIDVNLGIDIKSDELVQKFKEIKIEDFQKFLERVKLDTVYFLRGEK